MSLPPSSRPRIGIPYRTRKEELNGDFGKIEAYIRATRQAGSEPVVISLGLAPEHLKKIAQSLDGVLLSGSPADVDPVRYSAPRRPESVEPDPCREQTDFTLLDHALAAHKPVLAICYGIQSLNVFLSGSLVQDIRSELPGAISHEATGGAAGDAEAFHAVRIEPGSRLASLAHGSEARVNSSHHQSVLDPGRDLRVVASASDGVVEAVEWASDENWVMGVQWHPERMAETDPLAQVLFRSLTEASRRATVRI
jgi:putative glutamine amidotransferase